MILFNILYHEEELNKNDIRKKLKKLELFVKNKYNQYFLVYYSRL